MDDLIYTLLIIGWIAYGIFSAVKKNKAKANSSSASQATSTGEKSAVETVFESLFQENTQTYSEVNSPYYKSAPVDVSEEPDYQEEYDENSEFDEYEEPDYLDTVPEVKLESEIDTYSGTDNVESSIIIEEDLDEIQKSAIDGEDEGGNANSFDFDLRQAVIAQAVLERPHE